MGGRGAKERRRLERLEKLQQLENPKEAKTRDFQHPGKKNGDKHQHHHEGDSNNHQTSSKNMPTTKEKPSIPVKKVNNGTSKSNNKGRIIDKTNKNKSPTNKLEYHFNKNQSSSQSKKTEKKKFKKPKHLKRKLEQLNQEQQDQTDEIIATKRRALLDQMQIFKTNKAKHQQQQHQSKTTVETSNVIPKETNHIDNTRMHSDKSDVIMNSTNNTLLKTTTITATKNEEINGSSDIISKNNDNDDDNHSESSKENNDDDDDDVLHTENVPTRQRGRRRRGRKNTQQPKVQQLDQDNSTLDSNQHSTKTTDSDPPLVDNDDENNNDENDTNADDTVKNTLPHNNNDQDAPPPVIRRRCKGRKPVTDFVIGQEYSGTIVYMKPFGIFIDVMCHSDAFCHVSNLADSFVKEPSALYQVGDSVTARVIQISRKEKRITVSLCSQNHDKLGPEHVKRSNYNYNEQQTNYEDSRTAPNEVEDESTSKQVNGTKEQEQQHERLVDEHGNYLKPESEMTLAELKRARKLARRAERRQQQQQ